VDQSESLMDKSGFPRDPVRTVLRLLLSLRDLIQTNAFESKPMLYPQRLGVTWLQLIVRIILERFMKNPSPPQAQ
jgi:hypothetical protein